MGTGKLTSLCFHLELTRHKPVNRLCKEADVLSSVQVYFTTAVSLQERALFVPEHSEIVGIKLMPVPQLCMFAKLRM